MKDRQITETDRELAARICSDDAGAFEKLVAKYQPLLVKQASICSQRESDRDELMHEGRLALYRAAVTYRAETAVPFPAYAATCVRNAMISWMRKQTPNYVVSLDALRENADWDVASYDGYQNDPAGKLMQVEEEQQLKKKWAQLLSSYEYQVFTLYFGGLSTSAIAGKIGKDEKSVNNALSRAMHKLRALYQSKA